MIEIYIYGCGGVGNELAENFLSSQKYKLMGFIDDNPNIRECMGYQCRTLDEMLIERKKEEIKAIISIGEPAVRKIVSERLLKSGIEEISVDFSDKFNSSFSTIGAGTILHNHSYVSVNSHIGKSCMINKYALVGHDCKIGDYCVLSPKVTLGGDVTVGDNTYIGTGALIRNGIKIGKNVIVGIGAVVVKDVEDDYVVVGNPAKFIRINESKRVFKH